MCSNTFDRELFHVLLGTFFPHSLLILLITYYYLYLYILYLIIHLYFTFKVHIWLLDLTVHIN